MTGGEGLPCLHTLERRGDGNAGKLIWIAESGAKGRKIFDFR